MVCLLVRGASQNPATSRTKGRAGAQTVPVKGIFSQIGKAAQPWSQRDIPKGTYYALSLMEACGGIHIKHWNTTHILCNVLHSYTIARLLPIVTDHSKCSQPWPASEPVATGEFSWRSFLICCAFVELADAYSTHCQLFPWELQFLFYVCACGQRTDLVDHVSNRI